VAFLSYSHPQHFHLAFPVGFWNFLVSVLFLLVVIFAREEITTLYNLSTVNFASRSVAPHLFVMADDE
jgi:hypothetical protein